jgi:peroxiredoxin
MRLLFILVFLAALAVSGVAQSRQAADFSAIRLDGSAVELSRLKGKVVLITFWTTRCGICHSEIPKLNRMAESYAGKDVVFLAPTTDNGTKVNAYIQRNPFGFEILPDSFGLLLKYANRDRHGNLGIGYPAYFLIDRSGRIETSAMGWNHVSRLSSTIDKLLARSE